MSEKLKAFAEKIENHFGSRMVFVSDAHRELTYEVSREDLLNVAAELRDDAAFSFEQLLDVCAVDYLNYGKGEWVTEDSTSSGFARGVARALLDAVPNHERRFAVVYHLISLANNIRLRLKVYCSGDATPVVPSVNDIWNSANWFEREAFDLFGVVFEGHPDMRRILTDYGFVGYPFRKDFPLSGHVEVRFDPEKGRVVYQPVSIEPRTLVPRVIRKDHRYESALRQQAANAAKE